MKWVKQSFGESYALFNDDDTYVGIVYKYGHNTVWTAAMWANDNERRATYHSSKEEAMAIAIADYRFST